MTDPMAKTWREERKATSLAIQSKVIAILVLLIFFLASPPSLDAVVRLAAFFLGGIGAGTKGANEVETSKWGYLPGIHHIPENFAQ